jgi:hypothetical protein
MSRWRGAQQIATTPNHAQSHVAGQIIKTQPADSLGQTRAKGGHNGF